MYKKCSIECKSGSWITLIGKAFGYEINNGAIVINMYEDFSILSNVVSTDIFPLDVIESIHFGNE